MSQYKQTTKGGYDLGEVVSALQKEIRRGNEVEAMFWASEMLESGYGQYLWRRLIVITCEDIGLASPETVLLVHALSEMGHLATNKEWQERAEIEPVAMAVLVMCRAPKNREVDDFKEYVVNLRKKGMKLEIPDYALDTHTERGRQLHGGWDLFNAAKFYQDEGLGLSNRVEIELDKYRKKLYELLELEEIDGVIKPRRAML